MIRLLLLAEISTDPTVLNMDAIRELCHVPPSFVQEMPDHSVKFNLPRHATGTQIQCVIDQVHAVSVARRAKKAATSDQTQPATAPAPQ